MAYLLVTWIQHLSHSSGRKFTLVSQEQQKLSTFDLKALTLQFILICVSEIDFEVWRIFTCFIFFEFSSLFDSDIHAGTILKSI